MSNGISMPQGSSVPDDVKRKVDQYDQQLAKQESKIAGDQAAAQGWSSSIGKALKRMDLSAMKEDASRARQAWQQMGRDQATLQKMKDKAYQDIVNTWAQDLRQQGIDVPADLGTGEAALQKLASLQYGVDLEKRSADVGVYQGSITAQLMSAWLDRTNLLDKSLSSQLKDMQDKNKLLADANNVMSDLRSARPADSDDKKQVPSGIVTWAREHGVSVPDGVAKGDKVKQAVWDQFIQNIKSYVDNNNNDSQLMMVRLQDIQQKRDNAFELVSNLVKKLGSVDEQIISGMR